MTRKRPPLRVPAAKKAVAKVSPTPPEVPTAAPQPIDNRTHMQTVWECVQNHPDLVSRAISDLTKLALADVSGLLSNMTKRGMVKRAEKPASGAGTRGGKALHYVVNPKMKAFVLLDKPKEPPKAATITPATPETPKAPLTAKDLLDTLNVRDAFKLFQELSAMFENPNPATARA